MAGGAIGSHLHGHPPNSYFAGAEYRIVVHGQSPHDVVADCNTSGAHCVGAIRLTVSDMDNQPGGSRSNSTDPVPVQNFTSQHLCPPWHAA